MMERRQSGRRRGARVISDMRRLLADDFVKCKRLARAVKDAEFCFASFRGSGSRARDASENPLRSGIVQRRPVGVRLRLADVAARAAGAWGRAARALLAAVCSLAVAALALAVA